MVNEKSIPFDLTNLQSDFIFKWKIHLVWKQNQQFDQLTLTSILYPLHNFKILTGGDVSSSMAAFRCFKFRVFLSSKSGSRSPWDIWIEACLAVRDLLETTPTSAASTCAEGRRKGQDAMGSSSRSSLSRSQLHLCFMAGFEDVRARICNRKGYFIVGFVRRRERRFGSWWRGLDRYTQLGIRSGSIFNIVFGRIFKVLCDF